MFRTHRPFSRAALLLTVFALVVSLVSPVLSESADPYALPLDIHVGGSAPDPAGVTENGYHDETLDVRKETVRYNDNTFHIAWFTIKSPTQLRTTCAGLPNTNNIARPLQMGKKLNAVLILNGEFYVQRTQDIFVWRQGEMYRNQADPQKDVLIIDENADFHVFTSENKQQEIEDWVAAGGTIVNAFSFGPALIIDGVKQTVREDYYFDGQSTLPRSIIAQVGPLSYVFVECEGRKNDARGCTHQQMADFMETLNVQTAYNVDGGQSSVMILNNRYADDKTRDTERQQSDIIYVVSARDAKE